jgi:hypothetical protein
MALHARHQGFCPTDNTCHWRLTPADAQSHSTLFVACLSLLEQLAIHNKLLPVAFQNVSLLLLQSSTNFWKSIDVLQVRCTFNGTQVIESVIDQFLVLISDFFGVK